MADYSAFFAGNWHRLRQAGLYAASPRLDNPDWERAALRVLVLRLSSYRDADRSTPHLFLAQEVRAAEPGAFLDFCFFPPEPDRRLLEASRVPLATGLASRRSLEDFDLLLASCSYHLELLNLYYLLSRSGAPLRSGQRGESFPLLVVGGSSAMAAQGLIFPDGDCLADGLFFGEGEGLARALVRVLAESRARPRKARLQAAASVRGFWPAGDLRREVTQAVYRPGEGQSPEPLEAAAGPQIAGCAPQITACGPPEPPPYPVLSGPEAATARLTLSYGCPFRCAFCFEGYERRPYRPVPLGELLETASRLKRSTGAHTLELASFNVNTHPELPRLLLEGNRLFAQVNFMSQRADILEATPGLLELEAAAGKRSYTLGVEGISARLRAFLQKRLEEGAVRRLLERLLAGGAREAKLFYLLTGYEGPEDFAEFRAFLGWLRDRKRDRGLRLVFSFNRLVRMPFTPLAYDRLFLREEHWEPLVREARVMVETVGEFRLASSWPEYAVSQVLALGGRWLHEPLEAVAEAGLCFDRELPAAAWRLLARWLEAHPREAGELAGEKPPDYPFPLGFVRTPVPASARHAQYLRSRESLDQGRPDRSPIDSPPMHLPPNAPEQMAELMRRKARLKPVYLTLEVPREAAGGSPEWLEAWMLARLLERHPALLDNLLSVRETLFAGRDPRDRFPPWHGRSVFALTAWDPEALSASLGEGPAGPPEVAAIRLRLQLPEPFFPLAGERLAEYLASEHAPATARRVGPDLVLEPGARALKRKVLLEGVVRPHGQDFLAELTVGPRFRLRRYLELFPEPEAWRRAMVEVLDLA
jgi:radical SAM superfamily enzyme YgiQ (UPF0313 family)